MRKNLIIFLISLGYFFISQALTIDLENLSENTPITLRFNGKDTSTLTPRQEVELDNKKLSDLNKLEAKAQGKNLTFTDLNLRDIKTYASSRDYEYVLIKMDPGYFKFDVDKRYFSSIPINKVKNQNREVSYE